MPIRRVRTTYVSSARLQKELEQERQEKQAALRREEAALQEKQEALQRERDGSSRNQTAESVTRPESEEAEA